ncbi:MAG: ABC transporter permease [Proteobacteria bacterium]|nr:ABC transporter permease [Pseudomonadota bacterium]
MLKNYITVALRNLLKNRLYTAINIFGLAVGLASCILILLYVRHETSYDSWFPNAERIYQVGTRFDVPGREPFEGGQAPGPTMDAMVKDFSEIEAATRITSQRSAVTRGADVFTEMVVFADPNLFEVLDFPLVSGSKENALADVSSILLSESLAQKYFGSASPIGRTLPILLPMGMKRDYRVTGVFKELPTNTHLDLHMIARLNSQDFEKWPWVLQSWTSINASLYLKLKEGADAAAITRALPDWEKRSIPSLSFGGQDIDMADMMTLSLVKLTDIHLHGKRSTADRPRGDMRAIAAFTAVAVMILLIACINFTNLATARASQRAREVALRKVLGARRSQLVFQFLSESLLLSAIAFMLAIAFVYAALPFYNSVLNRDLGLNFVDGGLLLPVMATLIVVVGLAAGLYPAMVLSGFRPARILKANKSAAAEGSGKLRAALVVVQFAISIGLVVCTTVIYTQTVYARNIDSGFDRNGLLIVRALGALRGEEYKSARESIVAEAAKIPGVTAVTRSNDVPTDNGSSNNIFEIPGRPSTSPILISSRIVDFNYFDAYKIPLLAGRAFEEGRGGDDYTGTEDDKVARGGNIILNQAALGKLGIGSPQEAIGKEFRIAVGDAEKARQTTVTVVGVVGNIAYRSARDPIEPTFYIRDEENLYNLSLRADPAMGAAVNAAMERLWRQRAPHIPYRSEFMETRITAQYAQETAEAKMFAAFSALAIIIGALGLYGLALFSAERRTKEIGIRKVLGAKVRDVVRLLVLDFSKPVLIANLVAWPVAGFLMRDWLNGFEQRISLNPMIFGAAGFLALLVAWLTVGSHAFRAAQENPIRALRYE